MYRILIADDEDLERDGVEFLIRRKDASVEIQKARNGKEALMIFDQHPFDIVFTDVKMPLMDGIELCRHIRQRSADTVLVVLSAYGEFEYAQQAIKLHVDDYLLKPVSVEEFDHVVENALKHAGRRMSPDGQIQALSQQRDQEEKSEQETDSRIVSEVMQCVEKHYMENIGLEWAAEQVNLSAGYLSGYFKRILGKSFTQYLIEVRMKKAVELLTKTNMRVTEVGEAVGFNNASYFCLQFRKYYGMTPNQMRQRGG